MRNQKRRATQMFALIAVLFAVTAWFVLRGYCQAPVAKAAASAANPLIGMWEMTVVGSSGTYRYKYAVSDGAWVAIGNIDEGFLNYHYSPTIGAYVKNADGSYSYRERGWTYTRGGVCNGAFESTGTFVLDASGNTFSGPGVFKQFDLAGNVILTDSFTVVATKVSV